ncbi:MAG: permease [Deltaproteobacteria bacterium]|nr:permease [Deltaproteobacteria bacterium]
MGEKIGGGTVFLLSAVACYAVLGFVNPALLGHVLVALGRLVVRIAPLLVLVFGMMFVVHLVLDPEKIGRLLGRQSGLKGWLLAISGGIVSSGPIYMWYPLLSDLKERGMKESLIAAFLYNRSIKIPLLPMMVYYFGWPFTLVLSIYMVVFSVINGVVVGKVVQGGHQ